jgi:hypothetical protein
MSRRRGYKRYSAEFKREALKRASEDGMTDKAVCCYARAIAGLISMTPIFIFASLTKLVAVL